METVEVVEGSHDPLARWSPHIGPETLALIGHLGLSAEGANLLTSEAVAVLGRCAPPSAAEANETGLVLGYVQSGKTMSFTTVAALARDNGYRLIVVCTGLTVNLFNQSKERLERDLRLLERRDRKWLFLANPRCRGDIVQMVNSALEDDPLISDGEPRTVLVAVMKNGRWLDQLAQLLAHLDMAGIPSLVVDDEADQASLNNDVRRGTESPTYQRMVQLRGLLPHHTFLQYTATPQALLLINMIDVLSPSFAEVLTPGENYTGGQAFFEGNMALVREIPDGDIPDDENDVDEPPESLLEAMRAYFLGVAAGLLAGSAGNRSMMVHPSRLTLAHGDYAQWVRTVKDVWGRILREGPGNADYEDLLADFSAAHHDLDATVAVLPTIEELAPYLPRAVWQTVVIEVNAAGGRTPQPDWRQVYSHIVVGGDVLNRGFTIEGLTVTYMPRGTGMRQADTIQQRARWFGYKADYLGYCRVYLSADLIRIFRAYVDHETRLRRQLQEYRASGRSLQDWRRAFFLDESLRPTRNSVISLEPLRGSYSDSWYRTKAPHDSPEALVDNRQLTDGLRRALEAALHPDTGDPRRTDAQTHLVAEDIALATVYEQFLTAFRMPRLADSVAFTGLLLQVGRYLEGHPDALCSVYWMSGGAPRDRGVDDNGEILNLHQGANYDESTTPRTMTYPGDSQIHPDGNLGVQIHNIRITGPDAAIDDVPTLAVWVPRCMGAGWLSQGQHA